MIKILFIGILFLISCYSKCQSIVDSTKTLKNYDTSGNYDTSKKYDTSKSKRGKPEIFTSGFIDVINNGQVNASARFIKLNIGEPGKFTLPISFYGGVSNNTFQNNNVGGMLSKSNDHLVNQYINPLGGFVNIMIENLIFFKRTVKLTKMGIVYQIGERILSGTRIGNITDPLTGKPVNFLNSYAATGFYFQTGAWERNDSENIGIFWIALRYHITKSNPKQIAQFLPDVKTNGFYHGYSIGFGIEINNLVNIKAIFYKYSKAPEIDYGLPIYQFSFNYSLKN